MKQYFKSIIIKESVVNKDTLSKNSITYNLTAY